jgi:hypothetical protein
MPTQRRYRATSATIALNVALAIATPAAAQDARTGDAADRRQAAAVTGVVSTRSPARAMTMPRLAQTNFARPGQAKLTGRPVTSNTPRS